MKRMLCIVCAMMLASIACDLGQLAPIPSLETSPFASGTTVFGFFPSPPEASEQSILNHYRTLGRHADVILLQQPVPWRDFYEKAEADSPSINDIHNQYVLARQNGMEVIFVVDPLNGLNRREFFGLPMGWEASFANPRVRSAITNYALRIVREFHPPYLGLASEINTYADAFPEDFPNYLSLYQSLYDAIKAEAPSTQVFVTFQWEDLNNLIPTAAEGRSPYQTNWETVEAFEPRLDVWAISSYPFVVFHSASEMPHDYYAPLLGRTSKPLAVAEGGYTSQLVGPFPGSPEDQVVYLRAIHDQIGPRLRFWIYLLLSDFNLESYAKMMRDQGQGQDVETLGMFAAVGLTRFDGTPKPAIELWDAYRAGQ
jgi:hypothetical protein